MRVGREWRFALQNLRAWVVNGSQADQLTTVLRNGRPEVLTIDTSQLAVLAEGRQ